MLEISIPGLINFILGIFSGFVLFIATYTYLIVRGQNKNLDIIHKPKEVGDEDKLKDLIIAKQEVFKKQYKKDDKALGKKIFELSYELLEEISTFYFPKSKHPTLELSINEFIALNHYITERVDKILDQPLLKNTRNIRVTRIVSAFEAKKAIEEKKLVKAARNKTVKTVWKTTLGVINVMNPAYWFRKLVVNTSIDFVTKRVALLIIGVVGEETSKIYSKKLFDKDLEFDLVEKELLALEKGEDDEDN